jgi:hypothetical protein
VRNGSPVEATFAESCSETVHYTVPCFPPNQIFYFSIKGHLSWHSAGTCEEQVFVLLDEDATGQIPKDGRGKVFIVELKVIGGKGAVFGESA